jgi:uncharacterized protein
MSMQAAVHESQSPQVASTALLPETVRAAVDRAGRRMAPLWSLRHFVAVNPYLGMSEQPFEAAATLLGHRAGARMTAPRAFYADAIRAGHITDADLAAALDGRQMLHGAPQTVAALKAFALGDAPDVTFETVPTVADIAGQVTGKNWSDFVTEAVSQWAGTYFDQGQSYWHSPWADEPPYAAWRAEATIDRTPEVSGVRGFRRIVAELPDFADATIEAALEALHIPIDGLDAYLHRLLLTINGWASYARYQLWEAELHGGDDHTLTELLAIRLAWEVALLRAFEDNGLSQAWAQRLNDLTVTELDDDTQAALTGDLLLQVAFEKAYQRQLFSRVAAPKPAPKPTRPQVQAAFCIDVRSEVFRRALESVSQDIETIGFAGFFGFPIEYVRLGDKQGGAQCPVLLRPQFVITETVGGASANHVKATVDKRTMHQRITKAWRSFKFGAVSCFGFVGPVGLAYIRNLLQDTFGWARPVPLPASFGLNTDVYSRLMPSIETAQVGERMVGMLPEQRLDTAEGVLKAMSLTDNFARIVLLTGHGSTTVNNPYATGLDCGACGGHSGGANARVATQVMNDPNIRAGLRERGIAIPGDTVFVAAQHDTTTDQVTIFDKKTIPASHEADIAQLEAHLTKAAALARADRSVLLHIDQEADVDQAVIRRSTDWSQVRPEWGLAGCAAFIVAPRERTAGIDLDGRSFLHSYDWHLDEDFGVLELIMTAPMVVATWINLQYYASTVDNVFFGSGNKVLHNVVGTLGVLEGNGGDLRVGLPWQSVHDGEQYIHEPLRLNVMIEAPIDAMTEIISKHESVRQLVDNGWLHLFALDADGSVTHQYTGDLTWTPRTQQDLRQNSDKKADSRGNVGVTKPK